MEDLERISQQESKQFREYITALLAIANRMISSTHYQADDSFGFMLLVFLSKQVGHTESMIILKGHRDAQLIARSMLEGLIQIRWTQQDPEKRSSQWQKFVCVSEWRELRFRESLGQPANEEQQNEIMIRLAKFGDEFLTEKARKSKHADQPLKANSYHDNWTKRQVGELFNLVEGNDLRWPYSYLSDWQHWGPKSLGSSIHYQDLTRTFLTHSHATATLTFRIAFQCLMETAEIIQEHFQMNESEQLAKLKDDYVAWHQQIGLN